MTEKVAVETTTSRTADATQYEKDVLYICPSEHSSLVLTSTLLDDGSTHFEQWRRVNLTITLWIWNSISLDIIEAFICCATSRQLWIAIQRRYGRSNGPMVYQLQCEISSVSQQDLSLIACLTKVTKLWNELSYLDLAPKCRCGRYTCGVNNAIANLTASTQGVHVELGESASHMAYQLTLKENRREVKLSDTITLDHVLLMLEFSVNLLSDHATKDNLVMGILFEKLYAVEQYNTDFIRSSSVSSADVFCSSSLHCNSLVWHNRLGHASLQAIKHIRVEPKTYSEVVKYLEWRDAMKVEIDALKAQGWPLQQMDVNNAFLYGHLDEDLYMIPLTGPCMAEIQTVKDYLYFSFTIKDIRNARYSRSGNCAKFYWHLCYPNKVSSLVQTVVPCYLIQISIEDSRRSLNGFCIFLGGAFVSWKTKKQSTVSRSMFKVGMSHIDFVS
ncbi:hypothetical protein Sango_0100800 [Sesamum angolense]|uniref:GAG-pre-integrase domain-containing protein n=1 Tax=Sesamum angolense TaxID=2727404 RepID=A0AAE1XF49_9LAMI|nr:hypothetical protein Sango_0100800 [Sesamum angolense]